MKKTLLIDNISKCRIPLIVYIVGGLIFSISANIITEHPGTPYNIRELFLKQHRWISYWLFYTFMLSIPITGATFAIWVRNDRYRWLWAPIIYFFLGIIAWFLISNAVTLESLWDILGTPILKWSGNLELIFRFALFYIMVLVPVVIANSTMLTILKKPAVRAVRANIFIPVVINMVLALVGYLFIGPYAATDNVRELFLVYERLPAIDFASPLPLFYVSELYRDYNGLLATVAIYPLIFLLALNALIITCGCLGPFRWSKISILTVFLSAILIWPLLPFILTGNAMKFLLGPNREAVLAESAYFIRYFAAILVITFIFIPGFWISLYSHKQLTN